MQQIHTEHGLLEQRIWVFWEPDRAGKKIPMSPHTWKMEKGWNTNPNTWGTYEEAVKAAGKDRRIGFIIPDGYVVVDIDNGIDGDGEFKRWALEILDGLNSYTELSPSGTGLHVIAKATKPGKGQTKNYHDGKVELFGPGRFITVTHKQVGAKAAIEPRQTEIARLYWSLFPSDSKSGINTVGVHSGSALPLEDEKLLEKARNAASGQRFIRLYDYGDTSSYSYDDSVADIVLCGMLAFWTGKDAEQMDRLFRASKLMRKKWDERRGNSTYGERTITLAIKNCRKTYDQNYKTVANQDIHRMLDECMRLVVLGDLWGSCEQRDVYKALLLMAMDYGRKVDGGVEVKASIRDLAPTAGIGQLKTVRRNLDALIDTPLVSRTHKGNGRKAATYVIASAQKYPIINRVNKYGVSVRTPSFSLTARIRNASPTNKYTIGKRNSQIIDYVYVRGEADLEELAKHLGMRKSDLRRRHIEQLLDLGLLEQVDNVFRTPDDIEARLEMKLEESGCKEAEDVQRRKYEIQRQRFRGEQSTVLITSEEPPKQQDREYLEPDEVCIHGIKELCYLHNPNHPYRFKEKGLAA